MASKILIAVHALQAAFAAYNLYLASISIKNLQGYEDQAKKAAEWSSIAEKQLHKTRTTQASGTLTVLFSFISSAALIIYASRCPNLVKAGVAAANIAALMLARQHVGDFWKGKAKIPLPGVGDYNEAIGTTQESRLNMAYMMVGWAVAGLGGLVL